MMKKMLLFIGLALMCWTCQAPDEEGWLKDKDAAYRYKFLTPKNNALGIDYGDELTLSYTILKGDSVLERNLEGDFLTIPMPTRDHRNPWENALMHATLGDSIAVRAIYKSVYNTMSRFEAIFSNDEWITCHFKVHAIEKREAIEKAQENIFLQQARYTSHAAMKRELALVAQEHKTIVKDLNNWVLDMSLGKPSLPLLIDEKMQIKYQMVPTHPEYELLHKGAVAKGGDTVLMHYMMMKVSDREIFDNSLARNHRFEFVLDTDTQYIPAFHQAVRRLAVGESAYFWMPANLCYGEQGSLPIVPPNTPLVLYVHLLGVIPQ